MPLLEGRFAACESKKGALGLTRGLLGWLGAGAALATPVGLMSRLAILSDVHADVYALRDALLQIERLGCDSVVCAGDLVDYGPFPEETLALLMECNIPTIRGNHDRCAVLESRADRTWSPSKRALGGGLVCNPGPLLRDSVDPLEIPAAGTFGVLELPSCAFHVYAAATGQVVRHRSGDVRASSGPAAVDWSPALSLLMDDQEPTPCPHSNSSSI